MIKEYEGKIWRATSIIGETGLLRIAAEIEQLAEEADAEEGKRTLLQPPMMGWHPRHLVRLEVTPRTYGMFLDSCEAFPIVNKRHLLALGCGLG